MRESGGSQLQAQVEVPQGAEERVAETEEAVAGRRVGLEKNKWQIVGGCNLGHLRVQRGEVGDRHAATSMLCILAEKADRLRFLFSNRWI